MPETVKVNIKNYSYQIIIGNNILENANNFHEKYFYQRPKIVIFDTKLSKSIYLKLLIAKLGKETKSISVPSGEKSKSINGLNNLYNKLFSNNIDRNTVIYAFGGGVIGDLSGFAAATYMRGIDYVQVPTTLLSQIDSSVGGKTAINSSYGKNLIGAFYQPKLVLIDINTLMSLPKKQMLSGYAEMVKYGLINNSNFFSWLESNGKNILEKDKKKLEYAIAVCCKSKSKIVEQDEKEIGLRALLNLGHTFGHAFERLANFKNFTHGEAVSVGTILAFKLSNELNYCTLDDFTRISIHFKKMNLPTHINDLFKKKVKSLDTINAMKLDKKTVNNRLKLILSKGIGKAFICDTIDENNLNMFLKNNGFK
tara:strand:+ start:82 stop:1182 length:1101 start_codon:yes stop_codon:yes gene_type:complete